MHVSAICKAENYMYLPDLSLFLGNYIHLPNGHICLLLPSGVLTSQLYYLPRQIASKQQYLGCLHRKKSTVDLARRCFCIVIGPQTGTSQLGQSHSVLKGANEMYWCSTRTGRDLLLSTIGGICLNYLYSEVQRYGGRLRTERLNGQGKLGNMA
jgi:hypothetical protein